MDRILMWGLLNGIVRADAGRSRLDVSDISFRVYPPAPPVPNSVDVSL